MKNRLWLIFGLLSLIGIGQSTIANPFAKIKTPSHEPLESVGGYSNGCLFGADQLSKQGDGYQTMRQSRNRHYGHTTLINYIKYLGRKMAQRQELLLIGDMSQPRGGRMPSDHASHQIGLDADIWLYRMTPKSFSSHMIESLSMRSVVDRAQGVLNQYWDPTYVDLIATAANYEEVDRIFINPIIKKELCRVAKDASWQYKIRPWFGHDSHFHVRLKCPKGSNECIKQAPVPRASGCTADLDNWIQDQIQATIKPKAPPRKQEKSVPPPSIPTRCYQMIK